MGYTAETDLAEENNMKAAALAIEAPVRPIARKRNLGLHAVEERNASAVIDAAPKVLALASPRANMAGGILDCFDWFRDMLRKVFV